ncbi:MAG TPA: M3 family metallopeptidase [Pseudomonas sp.]|uniref:M3 family metallopeptidase n=1 Tax=Pseudomonas sp. TaxID=306 RepID=UPI002B5F3BF9|nr:M3 family metallopeptidase [Pseudomonas sp.]HWH88771.1 M3 family metallopeptidase [Pseudomonas sp.]
MPDTNPLLQNWSLPPWSAIRAEHLVPAIDRIVADNRQVIAHVVATQTEHPGWDDVVVAIAAADARLAEAMAVIETLSTVRSGDSDWLRERALCRLTAARHSADQAANLPLYRTFQKLEQSPIAANFDDPRKASLAKILRTFRQSGIELQPDQQRKLARLNHDIQCMEELFQSNLELANAAWSKRIDDITQLEGLSAQVQARLALNARQAGHGGWLLKLDQDTHRQILTYAQNRALREEYFTAWMSRASDQGPQADKLDNEPVLTVLIALRHEKADLLGFENYARLRLENRMATSAAQVDGFLRQQLALNAPALARDEQELKAFALSQGIASVQPWDEDFLAEQLRLQQLNGALKGLREYFPFEGTLHRLCRFCEYMFGIDIIELSEVAHWHEHVRLLQVSEHGQVIGHIYIDPYHREDDVDYPFTSVLRIRHINAEGRPSLPIVRLYGNLRPATEKQPCLLSHEDLRMLFHEFGHCLHHVLTRSPHRNIAGISQLTRDTAEFAGQLFEHWCLAPEFLRWLGAHYQSGERLTPARIDTALAALKAHTSRATALLLMWAMFDLQLHGNQVKSEGEGRSIEQVFEDVQRDVAHLRLSGYHRFACSFDYLVTGYDASVYAYKWSGVLATRVFRRFQRDGVFNPQAGRDFREAFFAPGDSRSLLRAAQAFLGEPFNPQLFAAEPTLLT